MKLEIVNSTSTLTQYSQTTIQRIVWKMFFLRKIFFWLKFALVSRCRGRCRGRQLLLCRGQSWSWSSYLSVATVTRPADSLSHCWSVRPGGLIMPVWSHHVALRPLHIKHVPARPAREWQPGGPHWPRPAQGHRGQDHRREECQGGPRLSLWPGQERE